MNPFFSQKFVQEASYITGLIAAADSVGERGISLGGWWTHFGWLALCGYRVTIVKGGAIVQW